MYVLIFYPAATFDCCGRQIHPSSYPPRGLKLFSTKRSGAPRTCSKWTNDGCYNRFTRTRSLYCTQTLHTTFLLAHVSNAWCFTYTKNRFVQVFKRADVGGWVADVSISYRQPNSFQSPFMVQPRQAIVDPRSEGAFKVTAAMTRRGRGTLSDIHVDRVSNL